MATSEGCLDQDEAAQELNVRVLYVVTLVLTDRLDRCPAHLHDRPRCEYVTRASVMRYKEWRTATPWWRRTLIGTKTFLKELANGF